MKQIKFILVNETGSENAGRAISDCKLSDIRHNVIVEADGLSDGFKCQVASSKLLDELVRLRRHYPDAKILGISELGEHCVHPSKRMNVLRRELSDLR